MESDSISALVLAAGHSSRMGQPKMTLPWGDTTVIGKVIATLVEARLNRINVVIGANRKELESTLQYCPVQYVHNEYHATGGMLSSVKAGLKSLPADTNAALIVLGDQPQIEVVVVEQIVEKYMSTKGRIIVPSYHRHRGHPWLVDRYYWEAISQLSLTITLREFLQEREEQILYVDVDTSSILEDLDTPQDYLNHRPGD